MMQRVTGAGIMQHLVGPDYDGSRYMRLCVSLCRRWGDSPSSDKHLSSILSISFRQKTIQISQFDKQVTDFCVFE